VTTALPEGLRRLCPQGLRVEDPSPANAGEPWTAPPEPASARPSSGRWSAMTT